MPFAGGAQAQDETQFALREAALVRVRDDRGIEKRRGFQGILAGEERADVELARLGERAAAEDVGLDPLEVDAARSREYPTWRLANSAVTAARCSSVSVSLERQGAADDIDDARGIRGDEGADQDAGAIGTEADPGGTNVQAAHGCESETGMASARVSSAKER